MKKIITSVLIIILLLTMFGCGSISSQTNYSIEDNEYSQIYIESSETLSEVSCFCSTEKGIIAASGSTIDLYTDGMSNAAQIFSNAAVTITAVGMNKSGNIAALAASDNEQTLYTLDFEGNIIATKKTNCSTEISQILFSANNEPFLASSGVLYDIDGKVLVEDSTISFLVQATDKILVVTSDSSVFILNEEDMTWEQPLFQNEMFDGMNITAAAASGNRLYISADNGVYYYDMDSELLTQQIQWGNEQYESSVLTAVISETELLTYRWSLWGTKDFYLFVSGGDFSTELEKRVLTMAGWTMYPWVEMAVEKFNKTNSKYRIEFENYYDTYGDRTLSDADTRILLRFSGGDMPDIICMEASDYEDYANAGLLLDIYPLMDEDAQFEKDSLIENVLCAMEKDEQLLQIAPFFGASTLVCYEPQVGSISGWTFDQFRAYTDIIPSGTVWIRNMTNQSFLKKLLDANLDSFIDTANNTCSFESSEFIKILELSAEFPSEQSLKETTYADVYDQNVDMISTNITSIETINDMRTIFHGSPVFVSYPSGNECGPTGFSDCRLGISSSTAYPDAAWEFIKSTLSQEFQDFVLVDGMDFPLNSASFEKILEETVLGPDGAEQSDIPKTLSGGLQVSDVPFNQEEIDMVRSFVYSISRFGGCMSGILDIVEEEAAAYFAGDKSAEEVAAIIQNRVQTYIAEQG